MSVKSQSYSRSRTNHSQITHRSGLCVLVRREIDQNFGVSGVEITDESRMNHAWTAHVSFTITVESLKYRARRRIRANTVQYSTNIRRTPDAWITDGARPKTHASRTFHVQALSFCDERDACAVRAWYEGGASVDGRERVRFRTSFDAYALTADACRRIVTHTRRINYARRLKNNADFFNRSKLKITQIDAHPLTITDRPRSIHRRITHTTHAPRRNENWYVICAWFMRFRCVTGPLRLLRVSCWSKCFCMGHFVMLPLKLTNLHCFCLWTSL